MSIYQRFCRETVDDEGHLVSFDLVCPDNFNFGYDVADRIAEETPDKRALVWCNTRGDERIFTFSDIRSCSNKMANVFLRAGIRRGDCVMLILKRHYEYWFAAIALHKIGAVMIPATHMLTVSDLTYRIRTAKIKAVVCTTQDGVTEKIREAIDHAAVPVKCWCVQHDTEGFVNLTRAMTAASDRLERMQTGASDPMMLYFTSGTTGMPKGVIHDFRYPLAHIVTAKYWQQAEEDGLHFAVAETGWAKASWGKLYGQWLVGSAVMVFDFNNFDPRALVQVINRYGVTSFCAPPTVYRYLVRKGIPSMPTLRHASTAGEELSGEVFRTFKEQTGIDLCEGYGQTESALLMANFKGSKSTAGSMGLPSPLYKIALQDREGNILGTGQTGEVVVLPQEGDRQVGLFSAYLDDEEKYAYAWRGGVYHTGDLAYKDEHGRYWFQGRFDDIIKTGGFRIGPFEIENILLQHPAVAECSVVGVPDKLRGQAVKAVVVPVRDYLPTDELAHEIRDFCNQKLAEYKWIRLIEFKDKMPKTISGKIRKAALRTSCG